MDCPGNKLLSGTVFTFDDHGRIRLGHFKHLLKYFFYLKTLSDYFIRERYVIKMLPKLIVFIHKPPLLYGIADQMAHIIRINRFDNIIKSALFQRLNTCLNRRKSGDHDGNNIFVDFFDSSLKLQAINTGHLDIKHDNIPRSLLQLEKCSICILCRAYVIAVKLKPLAERITD